MDRANTRINALFLGRIDLGLRSASLQTLADEFSNLFIFGSSRERDYVIGSDRHELCAKQSVWPRGEDFKLAIRRRCGLRIERKTN